MPDQCSPRHPRACLQGRTGEGLRRSTLLLGGPSLRQANDIASIPAVTETAIRRRPLPLLFLALGLGPLLVVAGVWLISLSHQHYDFDCTVSGQMEKGWSANQAMSSCETAWQAQLAGGALLTIVGLVAVAEGRRRP